MSKSAQYAFAVLIFGGAAIAMASTDDGSSLSLTCTDPVVEMMSPQGWDVRIARKHCVAKMGPNARGRYEFYYEYDLYEFSGRSETLHARSYVDEPNAAHLLGIERGGSRQLLVETDLRSPLAQIAFQYLRRMGKTELTWLDQRNQIDGYSPVP
jgi:hypothetical protein